MQKLFVMFGIANEAVASIFIPQMLVQKLYPCPWHCVNGL